MANEKFDEQAASKFLKEHGTPISEDYPSRGELCVVRLSSGRVKLSWVGVAPHRFILYDGEITHWLPLSAITGLLEIREELESWEAKLEKQIKGYESSLAIVAPSAKKAVIKELIFLIDKINAPQTMNRWTKEELAEKLTEAFMSGLAHGYTDSSSVAQWYHDKEDREGFRDRVKAVYMEELKQE